jgi:hypothetical protein
MAKVALLIGVSEYAFGLDPLPAALNDVAELKNILQHSEMGGFDEVKSLERPICFYYTFLAMGSDMKMAPFILPPEIRRKNLYRPQLFRLDLFMM